MSILSSFASLFQAKAEKVNYDISLSGLMPQQDLWNSLVREDYLDQFTGWNYRAINIIANSIADKEIKLFKKNKTEPVEMSAETDQLLRDLNRFNGEMSLYDARVMTVIHRKLTGQAYWLIQKATQPGYIFEFYVLNPTRVSVITDKYGLPSQYKYVDAAGKTQYIAKENMVPFIDRDPRNWLIGYSTLEASKLATATYQMIEKHNFNVFGNAAVPAGILAVENITSADKKRIEETLRAKYQGINNAGKTMVSDGKTTFTQISPNLKDLDYAKGLEIMRDEILSIMGVPKPLVGLSDSTYANSEEAQRIFQRYTLEPLLDQETSSYNTQLLPKYYAGMAAKATAFYFEHESALDIDAVGIQLNARENYMAGVITRNEAREAVGLEVVEDGDTYAGSQKPEESKQEPDMQPEVEDDETEVEDETEKPVAKALNLDDRLDFKDASVRKAVKKIYEEIVDRNEGFVEGAVKSFWEKQQARVLASLSSKGKKAVSIKMDWDYENEQLFTSLDDVLLSGGHEFRSYALELLRSSASRQLTPAQTRTLTRIANTQSNLINKFTREEISAIAKTTNNLDQARTLISELYEKYKQPTDFNRAQTIARTTTSAVRNYVQRNTYSLDDTVIGYTWSAAGDRETRDAHARADGQFRYKGMKFNVDGEALEYPGDPSGRPGNIINCRCDLLPEIE